VAMLWRRPPEQIAPLPLPSMGHEVEASTVEETPVLVVVQAGGGATEVSATDAMSASILKIIDLDAPDLPRNDQDIYEAMLERMLANPVESEIKTSRSAAPAATTSTDAVKPANEEPRRAPPWRGSRRRVRLDVSEVSSPRPRRRQPRGSSGIPRSARS
jgi:hypothetical protein